jgi:beta-lactam-binding protein with PASTA domain
MVRLFQFVLLLLGLSLVVLASAVITMRIAIHGAEVTVPNFHGLTAVEALNKAADLGVEMSIDSRLYSAEIPAGRIITQSPAAGTIVRREWHLRATESLGPQLVAIPNLIGQQSRAASMQLRRIGLDLGTVARMPVPSNESETIVAQDPAAGVERPTIGILLGEPARASISGFVMPDFTGQSYAVAAATISGAGLKLAPEIAADPVVASMPAAPGTVVSQSPPSGYLVDDTMAIELTVTQ